MRLIDADKLLAAVKENAPFIYHILLPIVALTHTEDAEPVRYGGWYQKRMSVPKGKGQTYLVWACGLCHKHEKKRSDYCPNCGAKMDGDANAAD